MQNLPVAVQEVSIDVISFRRHLFYILTFVLAICLCLAFLAVMLFPYYDSKHFIVSQSLHGYINYSIFIFFPASVFFGLAIGFVFNRIIIVKNNPTISREVKFSPTATMGKAILRPGRIVFPIFMVVALIASREFHKYYLKMNMFGYVPGLAGWNTEKIHYWTLWNVEPNKNLLQKLDKILHTPKNVKMRAAAARLIALTDSPRRTEPLIKALLNDKDITVQFYSSFGLARENESYERTKATLYKARRKGSVWAAMWIAWHEGGDNILQAEKLIIRPSTGIKAPAVGTYFHMLCRARWGSVNALGCIIDSLHRMNMGGKVYGMLNSKILSLLPEEIKRIGPLEIYLRLPQEREKLYDWYDENRLRIYWDAEKQKYLIKNTEDSE